jgi:endoglucanase Acf2
MPAPTFLELARSIDNALSGNIRFPFRAIAASGPVTGNDFYLTLDATAGAVVATLPSAVTVKSGMGFSFMRIDGSANAVTLATTGGQTINGAASAAITLRYGVLVAVSDGANWLLFSSPGAFALATDVFWTFPAQLSVDQNTNLYTLVAERAMSFVGVDIKLNVAPAGASVIVDWEINGVVNSNLRMTVAAGATFAQVAFPFALAINDTLHPIVIQVGSQTPGQAGLFRARGQ